LLRLNSESKMNISKMLISKLKCFAEKSCLMHKPDKLLGISNSNCMQLREMFKAKWLKERNSEMKHTMNILRREAKLMQLLIR